MLPVFIQMTVLPRPGSESPAQIRFNLRLHAATTGGEPLTYTMDGSTGSSSFPELEPRDGELVVKKYRSSGFWGTNLDMLLRSNGIKSVVVTGCTTEGCVESTARDAMFNDYYVVHRRGLRRRATTASSTRPRCCSCAHRFDMATSEDDQQALGGLTARLVTKGDRGGRKAAGQGGDRHRRRAGDRRRRSPPRSPPRAPTW